MQNSRKSMGGPKPMATVPEMVVALRASRLDSSGRTPTTARATMATLPATMSLLVASLVVPGFLVRKNPMSSGPTSLETEEKVESSVEMELVSITMLTSVKQVLLMYRDTWEGRPFDRPSMVTPFTPVSPAAFCCKYAASMFP